MTEAYYPRRYYEHRARRLEWALRQLALASRDATEAPGPCLECRGIRCGSADCAEALMTGYPLPARPCDDDCDDQERQPPLNGFLACCGLGKRGGCARFSEWLAEVP